MFLRRNAKFWGAIFVLLYGLTAGAVDSSASADKVSMTTQCERLLVAHRGPDTEVLEFASADGRIKVTVIKDKKIRKLAAAIPKEKTFEKEFIQKRLFSLPVFDGKNPLIFLTITDPAGKGASLDTPEAQAVEAGFPKDLDTMPVPQDIKNFFRYIEWSYGRIWSNRVVFKFLRYTFQWPVAVATGVVAILAWNLSESEQVRIVFPVMTAGLGALAWAISEPIHDVVWPKAHKEAVHNLRQVVAEERPFNVHVVIVVEDDAQLDLIKEFMEEIDLECQP